MYRIRLAAATLLALGAACARHAETPQPAEGPPTGSAAGARRAPSQDLLLRGIELSADQRSRIDSIRAKYRAQRERLDPHDNAGDRQKARDLVQHQRDEMRAVLTAEQQRVYDANMAELRDRLQRGAPGEQSPAPPRD